MLSFFPIPYPDETINSLIERYQKIKHATEAEARIDFFDNKYSRISLNNIKKLASKLKGDPASNFKTLLLDHSPHPLFTIDLHNPLPDLNLKSKVWCRECRINDMRIYGVSYIHRSHQIPGVLSCWKHNTYLSPQRPSNQPTSPLTHKYAGLAHQILHSKVAIDITRTLDAIDFMIWQKSKVRDKLLAPLELVYFLANGDPIGQHLRYGLIQRPDRIKFPATYRNPKPLLTTLTILFNNISELLETIDTLTELREKALLNPSKFISDLQMWAVRKALLEESTNSRRLIGYIRWMKQHDPIWLKYRECQIAILDQNQERYCIHDHYELSARSLYYRVSARLTPEEAASPITYPNNIRKSLACSSLEI